jgi:SSS family solute:Na+ symporter
LSGSEARLRRDDERADPENADTRREIIDLILVLGYFGLMLTVGWRARGGAADAYWVAARRYGPLPVSASLVATIFGASSTVGIIGLGYSRGLTGAWWALIGGMALLPFGLFLARKVRSLEVYTLPDILHRAYGFRVSILGAGIVVVAWCAVVAAQIVAGALLLGSVLPVGFQGALMTVSVVFVLYTLWGGQLSVIRTDSWQITLFAAALLITLALVVRSGMAGGGPLVNVPEGHLSFPVSPAFGWYDLLVFYPLIVGMPYLVGPDIYSRVLCAESAGAARAASFAAALAVVPLSFLLALLGLLIHAQFPGVGAEEALPIALTELAPPGLKGLIVVGVLGAIMSSADTTLISASTILALNVVSPLRDLGLGRRSQGGTSLREETPGDSPMQEEGKREQLKLTRAFVAVLGLVAWGIASFQQGIISSLLLAYTVFVGGIALPTLASFWKDRLGVSPSGAFWSVLLGGSLAFLGGFRNGAGLGWVMGESGSRWLEAVLGPEYGSILPLVVSVAVLLGVGRMKRR